MKRSPVHGALVRRAFVLHAVGDGGAPEALRRVIWHRRAAVVGDRLARVRGGLGALAVVIVCEALVGGVEVGRGAA